MTNLELLIESVRSHKPISFSYNREGKVIGERIGGVFAVYIHTAKATGLQSTMIHIVQTAGVSDSKDTNPFPDWRTFKIEHLADISILSDEPDFDIEHPYYNPESDMYNHALAKV